VAILVGLYRYLIVIIAIAFYRNRSQRERYQSMVREQQRLEASTKGHDGTHRPGAHVG